MMARKSAIYLIATALVLSSFTLVLFQNWTITPGYSIKFDGKYAHGSFDKLSGTINFDPLNLDNSKFDVVVDVASINTGIDLKNKHAKSDKWFDAEKYPVIHFVSSSVAKSDTGFVVRGELELHGSERASKFPLLFDLMKAVRHFMENSKSTEAISRSAKPTARTPIQLLLRYTSL
jgi:polyisoprenoid-binding protein YceI